MAQATNFNVITSPPAPITDQTTRISESFNAILTGQSGLTRPAYITTAGEGEWIDKVSSTNWSFYHYDGSADILRGILDPTIDAWTPYGDMSALGAAHWGAEGTIASAGTTTLAGVAAFRIQITGVVTITSFGTGVNLRRFLRFAGALILTHNATSLICPGGESIVTRAGDTCEVSSDGSSNWRITGYTRANGTPLFLESEGSIASSGTTDLATKRSMFLNITGTTGITSFGTGPWLFKVLRFSGIVAITHNATSLILPTGANITTAAGDVITVYSDGSGNWRVANYQRASGQPLASAAAANPIGTLALFAGPTLPALWLWAAGQDVLRSTYASLFAALSMTFTATTTNGSASVTVVSADLRNLGLDGCVVEGTGITGGTTITFTGATTATLSANAIAGAGALTALRIMPYGRGDGSTTFGIPDFKGRVGAGRDDMNVTGGGAGAGRILSTGTGSPGVIGLRLGNAGGNDRHTLTTAQLAIHGHPPSSGTSYWSNAATVTFTSGAGFNADTAAAQNAGSGNAHPILQPTIMSNMIIYAGV